MTADTVTAVDLYNGASATLALSDTAGLTAGWLFRVRLDTRLRAPGSSDIYEPFATASTLLDIHELKNMRDELDRFIEAHDV